MGIIENNKKTMDFYDSLLDYFEDLNKYQAKVGVHEDAGRDNVNKAIWNEFGTTHKLKYRSVAIQGEGLKPLNINNFDKGIVVEKDADISIPARPFVRLFLYNDAVDKLVKRTIYSIEDKMRKKIIGKKDAEETLESIGKEASYLMKQKIRYGNFDKASNKTTKDQEHNSLLTQYIKGKDEPLIDNSDMYNVIDYKIEKRGS